MANQQIAVCIPIYNSDVRELAARLKQLQQRCPTRCSIYFMDDASQDSFRNINRDVCKLAGTYIELPQNIGRSAIRNLFLHYTSAEYLLFIDGDSLITHENFLRRYAELIDAQNPDIVYGGRVHGPKPFDPSRYLRWKYGMQSESKSLDVRTKLGVKAIMANNLLVRRTVLENIPFDEQLKTYGHEDTLFAFQVSRTNLQVLHADNPVLNGSIDSALIFIEKTEEALRNLVFLYKKSEDPTSFANFVTLLHVLIRWKRWLPLMQFLYVRFGNYLRHQLIYRTHSVTWLNLYKLLYLSHSWQREK